MATFVRFGFFSGATPAHPFHPVHSYPHLHPHSFPPFPHPHTPQTSLYSRIYKLKKRKKERKINLFFNAISKNMSFKKLINHQNKTFGFSHSKLALNSYLLILISLQKEKGN